MTGEGKVVGGIIGIVIAIIAFFTTIIVYYPFALWYMGNNAQMTFGDAAPPIAILVASLLSMPLFGVIIWSGLKEMSQTRRTNE
jgi:hypothetical protein